MPYYLNQNILLGSIHPRTLILKHEDRKADFHSSYFFFSKTLLFTYNVAYIGLLEDEILRNLNIAVPMNILNSFYKALYF